MDEKRIEAAAKAIAKVMYAHKDWNLLNIATQNISRNYARAAAPILSDDRVREKAQTLVNALDRCEDMIKVALMLADYRRADCTKGGKLTYGKELDALKRALAGEGEQERVTVTCDLTGEQQHFIVHLDGKVEINFARELHANRYAAGLRAEIGGKE